MRGALLGEVAEVHRDDLARAVMDGGQHGEERVSHLATGAGDEDGARLGRARSGRLRFGHRGLAHLGTASKDRFTVRETGREYRVRTCPNAPSHCPSAPKPRRRSSATSSCGRTRRAASTEKHGENSAPTAGAPLELSIERADGSVEKRVLGTALFDGEEPQLEVPAGAWQRARSLGPWTLVGCTVSPGFLFEKFEIRA